jgi:hypothetical protein
MDLQVYYQKIRQIEDGIEGDHAVVVSKETPDGGKAGVLTETAKRLAATLVADGRAELASKKETDAFRAKVAEAKRAAENLAATSRVQLSVLPAAELEQLRNAARAKKD